MKENKQSDRVTKCASKRGRVWEEERGGGVKTEKLNPARQRVALGYRDVFIMHEDGETSTEQGRRHSGVLTLDDLWCYL